MTASERQAVLLQVDKEFYPHQWGEPLLSIESEETQTQIGLLIRKSRAFALMPYLNLETLSEDPARLLSLLQLRTQHSPEDWAPYDSHKLQRGWDGGFYNTYVEEWNSHYPMLHVTRLASAVRVYKRPFLYLELSSLEDSQLT